MALTAAAGPLRFCVVSTFYPPYNFGGDGIYAHRLANSLAARGHDVTVLHSPRAYEALAGTGPSAGYDDHPNVHVEPIDTPLGKLGLLAVQQMGRPGLQRSALNRWLNEAEYDVIHFNNVSLLGGPQVFRYGSALKLCTLIEHWLVCPMHVLWKFDREVCTKPTCLRCTLHGKRPPQLWRYLGTMRRATRAIDAFIGPSLFTIRMHRERGLRGTMVQLPLFQTEPAVDSAAEPAWKRPYFLFVGRLEKIKGVQAIIPSFRRSADFDLLIAGTGAYAPELQRMADRAPNIEFLGNVDQSRLHALYRGAIATVVPSLCYETFGVIVAESFCARTPVVAYAQSSPEEMIRTHGGGLTYRSVAELDEALSRLARDRELRDRLGREGRAAYEKEFAQESFMTNYLAVVRELLARKQAGRPGGDPPRGGAEDTDGAGGGDRLAGRPVFWG